MVFPRVAGDWESWFFPRRDKKCSSFVQYKDEGRSCVRVCGSRQAVVASPEIITNGKFGILCVRSKWKLSL